MEKIRVGVFGAGRGMSLAEVFMLQNAEIVAICDNHKGRREAALKKLDSSVASYEDFDAFI
jgi:predicted dehydrogenase